MNKAIIAIKTDREVKENAQALASELGLSLSDVLNASIRNFIRTREVRVSAAPQMTPELEALVSRAINDHRAGRNVSKPFATIKEMGAHLDSLT